MKIIYCSATTHRLLYCIYPYNAVIIPQSAIICHLSVFLFPFGSNLMLSVTNQGDQLLQSFEFRGSTDDIAQR